MLSGIKLILVQILFICLWTEAQCYEFKTLDHLHTRVDPNVQAKAARDLIGRVIGQRASDFEVIVSPNANSSLDAFHLVTANGKLQITGTTGVAAAMGFYYYIKQYCGCQFTWAGQQVSLPTTLVVIKAPGVSVQANDRFRYYQNVCTVSYSLAWFDWKRWERHIDWMAMQGINFPLAFTGQEAIFQRMYMRMGFTMEDLSAFFGGPAFLAWARMGNIQGWGGPLPQSWITDHLVLQHHILDRMRSLGMTPVLPAFAGHVPAAIVKRFPQAKVTKSPPWGGFQGNYTSTYLLDFEDPLFKQIGAEFIKEMINEFGVDHVYNADTFNEMRPKSSNASYLSLASKTVYESMIAGDPQAIWVMQGWIFQDTGFWGPPEIKALLSGVPKGKMIILDLQAEMTPHYAFTESYFGQPFIWCMLHDFGGTMELYGALDNVNRGPFIARQFPNSTMIGTGLSSEGIFQNEVMFEFMNEQAWRKAPADLTLWITDFTSQRYGSLNAYSNKAWQLLKGSVYNSTGTHHDFNSVPFTEIPTTSASPRQLWYKPIDLYQAWDYLLQAAPQLGNSPLYRYDLVDVTRNSLQILSSKFYADLIAAYTQKNSTGVLEMGEKMITLLSDLDTLLSSDEHFLLGNWIAAARKQGLSDDEKDLYEYNARTQITLWGPNGEILDYAAKQWAGLVRDYYLPRWRVFVEALWDSLQSGSPFNENAFKQSVFKFVEQQFTFAKNTYPTTPTGDSVKIATLLHQTYRPEMKSAFFDDLYEPVNEADKEDNSQHLPPYHKTYMAKIAASREEKQLSGYV